MFSHGHSQNAAQGIPPDFFTGHYLLALFSDFEMGEEVGRTEDWWGNYTAQYEI